MTDVLNDALLNLEHDNYELSYAGYENRKADISLIRAALAAQKDALEEILSLSSIDLVMRSDQFELTAKLGDIYQIADAMLKAREDKS